MEDSDEEWRTCAVGVYRAGDGYAVAGRRVIRLAEIMAGRRRTRKRRTTMWTEMCTGRGNSVLQAGETNLEGESSRQATSGVERG